MRIDPLGDRAYILRDLDLPAYEVAAHLQCLAVSGVMEAVASYDTVGVYVEPATFSLSSLEQEIACAPGRMQSREVLIPVCYELGPDLDQAAEALGMSAESLIEEHQSIAYRCYAIGFCPGFPYLGYLPDRIAGLPRLPVPRKLVEPGSVGIVGNQTGIYPLARPGGWNLIGRTPLCLVDVDDEYFPIESGDLVRFTAIDREEFRARLGERL